MKFLPVALFFFGLGSVVQAASIPILNSSFEADVLSCPPGCSTNDSITSWTGSSPAASGFAYGVYKPSTASYAGGVPNGVNVAYLLEDGPGVSISQTLTTNLQANDTYTLTLDLGLRSDTNVFNPGLGCYGFDASLNAGGNVLSTLAQASGNNNCNSVTTGNFKQFSFTYSSGANPAGLGSPLTITLTANGSGSPFEPGEIDFDQVTVSDSAVTGTAVPEPASWGIAFAGMVFLAWRFGRRGV